MERDRSAEPRIRTGDILANTHSMYRALSGVKPPKFHGKYTEDVNAWITIIEDQFYLNPTAEATKIAAVSALFKDDALTWYLWLRNQYQRPPSWTEFKKELQVKFADSPVHTAALRIQLSNVPYNGPSSMESYISKFRSLEVQISVSEMAFGDRLHYFIAPFEMKLKRAIKTDHPRTMELAYDAATDWAYINVISKVEASNPDPSLGSLAASDKDISEDELDTIEMTNIKCYNCNRRGHLSHDCTKPRGPHSRIHQS
jgi:Ty3 transposon capsid-like protein/Zinc knuckle